MKSSRSYLNNKAQSAVEYMLMFAAVSIVVFTALAPNGFFTTAVNESINQSILDGTHEMARCVCYDRTDGEPCAPVCGNGCCEPGEQGSCAADCDGDTYSWSTRGWGPCVPVCGAGERARVVHCVNNTDGTVVADRYCSAAKPSTTEACSGADCDYRWEQDGYGQCSVLCGPGTQSMTYKCVRGYDNMEVFASYCSTLPDPPDVTQACDLGQCCQCEFQSACTDGSVPCCGMSGCGALEHSEVQFCTPTGCVNPATLQTQCTPDAGCCEDAPGNCRESPCGWNERKYLETCGDGSSREVCWEDNSCILTCEGTDIVEHGVLCEDDNWGLTTTLDYETVDACTDRKCEILCDTAHNYFADGGLCVCDPPIFDENSYTDTAQGAGGSATYTSRIYSEEVDFHVTVWTEDLNYRVWFYDSSGAEIAFYSNACCVIGASCGCRDGDGNIDSASHSMTAYGVSVYLREGGSASSNSFGWNITGQFTGCAEEDCVPDCSGRSCGGDGCGGTCGGCSFPDVCDDGTCVCFPRCNECGSDGCGGDCGSCTSPETCYAGSCVGCDSFSDATECNNTGDCLYNSATSTCEPR